MKLHPIWITFLSFTRLIVNFGFWNAAITGLLKCVCVVCVVCIVYPPHPHKQEFSGVSHSILDTFNLKFMNGSGILISWGGFFLMNSASLFQLPQKQFTCFTSEISKATGQFLGIKNKQIKVCFRKILVTLEEKKKAFTIEVCHAVERFFKKSQHNTFVVTFSDMLGLKGLFSFQHVWAWLLFDSRTHLVS